MNDNGGQPSGQPNRFFDVVPPSKTTPSATSRPIIASNQPPQVDPMMVKPPVAPSEQDSNNRVAIPFPEGISYGGPSDQTADSMMAEEYKEVEHELPAGEGAYPSHQLTAVRSETVSDQLHGSHHFFRDFLMVFVVALLLLIIGDLLLDAGVWKPTYSFPHTHFLSKK